MTDLFDLFKKITSPPATVSAKPEFLVVGLGNPGDSYQHTRHNAGFITMDYLSQRENTPIKKIKFKSLCGPALISGVPALLMKPQTFMNHSGEAVREAADFYQIPPERTVVIFDDISLAPGTLRIKAKGSDGGHNGIKSIIFHLNSDGFPRVKLGVGAKPHPDMDLADWVLSKFTEEERKLLFACLDPACDSISLILQGKIEDAMAKYNRRA